MLETTSQEDTGVDKGRKKEMCSTCKKDAKRVNKRKILKSPPDEPVQLQDFNKKKGGTKE